MKIDYGVFEDVLAAAMIGSWKIEVDEGKEPRMLADATMMSLIGIKPGTEMSPEAVYHAWYDHIDPDHYSAVEEGVQHMMDGRQAEIQYPWHHPDGRTIVVRCGGVRDFGYKAGVRVAGVHQYVTDLVHVEKGREQKNASSDQILSTITQQLYGFNITVDLAVGEYTLITGTGTETEIAILSSTKNYREAFVKLLEMVRPEFRDRIRELAALDSLRLNQDHLGFFGKMEFAVVGEPERWIEVNVTFAIDGSGHPAANILARDITEARHEAARHEKEHQASAAKDQILSTITQQLYGFNVTVELKTGRYSLITGTGTERICAIFEAYQDKTYDMAVDAFLFRVPPAERNAALRLLSRDLLMARGVRHGEIITQEVPWSGAEGGHGRCEINVILGTDANGDPIANILGRNVTAQYEEQERREREREAVAAKDRVLSEITQSLYGYNITANLKTLKYKLIIGTGMDNACRKFARTNDYRMMIEAATGAVAPEDKEHIRALLDPANLNRSLAAGKRGAIGAAEYRVITEGGEEWREINLFLGMDANGDPVVNILGRNLTEQHERQVRQEREREAAAAKDRILSEITQSLYGYNLTVNLKTLKYTLITGTGMDAACEVFGKFADYAEAIRAKLEFVVSKDRDRVAKLMDPESLRRMAEGGSSGALATTVYEANVNGEHQWHETNVFLGTDANGDPIANILGRDVTEQQTRADAEAQLMAAQQANKAKTQFLFNMSHDIRTPMNAIRGFTEIAKKKITSLVGSDPRADRDGVRGTPALPNDGALGDRPLPDGEVGSRVPRDREMLDGVRDCLDKIDSSGELLLSLINSVLDMSRVESGKAKLEEVESDVLESFKGVETTMKELAKAKGISLSFEFGQIADRNVYADQDRCNRVFVNILSNAIKYSRPNGWIKARCEQIGNEELGIRNEELGMRNGDSGSSIPNSKFLIPNSGSAWFRYTFADNGIGMGEEFVEHVFEEFAREHNSTTSGIQGTGLGMPLCKSFVELMGGTITCKSKQGEGTTFTIELPFKVIETDENGARTSRSAEGGYDKAGSADLEVRAPSFAGRRVLLVEDNELNREVATYVLKEQGFEVDVAENGKIAVEKVCGNEELGIRNEELGIASSESGSSIPNSKFLIPNSRYDFILMDIQMPVMDGYEATRAIREWEKGKLGIRNEELGIGSGEPENSIPNSKFLIPNSHIPIIALSANAFAEDKAASIAAGMDDHVAKPIKVKDLLTAISKFKV